jgi:thiamine-phosphate pyrophosphorylase
MQYEFTSGARRALIHAGRWSARGGNENELVAPALLLGLLAETECRAAETLRRHGVSTELVHARWPDLPKTSPPDGGSADGYFAEDTLQDFLPFSSEVKASLGAVRRRMRGFEQPCLFATEHLLLGLVAAGFETAEWLRSQGLDADRLEEEIHRQYGHQREPLDLSGATEPLHYEESAGSPSQPDPSVWPDKQRPVTEMAGTHMDGYVERHQLFQPSGDFPVGEIGLLRVLDAAANRAREALRVIEDYVRFVLDDRHLTEQCKKFRHDLTVAMAEVSMGRRLQARETQADVGTELATAAEYRRDGMAGILAANFARLQESLRSLEEFGKLLSRNTAACCERLRYRTYTLQRAVEITRTSLERLARVRLYVLVDGGSSADQFAEAVQTLVAAGVHAIQLRDKHLHDRTLLERARILRQITRTSNTLFVMNDRPDLATLSDADGVHVGQEELTVKDARTIVGPDALVGLSTHSIEQARQAVLDGADYIGVGPTFPSGTKQFEHFPGLDLVRAVAGEVRLPAFAIGGITPENLPQVISGGIARVAVSGCVTKSADPSAAVQRMLTMLGGAVGE